MKTKILTALCIAGVSASTLAQTVPNQDNSSGEKESKQYEPNMSHENGSVAVAADAIFARPMCFAATVIGSALFVVCLPVAAISHSVKHTAHVLVVKPARATFTRPLGDLDDLKSS
jgi:hypothetical protein